MQFKKHPVFFKIPGVFCLFLHISSDSCSIFKNSPCIFEHLCYNVLQLS